MSDTLKKFYEALNTPVNNTLEEEAEADLYADVVTLCEKLDVESNLC